MAIKSKTVFMNEIIKSAYEKYYEELKDKTRKSKELSKQLTIISMCNGNHRHFAYNSLVKKLNTNLTEILSDLITSEVEAIILVRKTQKSPSKSQSFHGEIYGKLYTKVQNVCIEYIGNEKHLWNLNFYSKTNLRELVEKKENISINERDNFINKIWDRFKLQHDE